MSKVKATEFPHSLINSISFIKQNCVSLLNIDSFNSQILPKIDPKSSPTTSSISAEQCTLQKPLPQNLKRQVVAVKMADMFVPSPGLYNVTSPHSSIYDMDRPDQSACCVPTSYSNPSDSIFSDEIGLDDKLEDSNLQNYLTPDVINSLQAAQGINNPLNFWSVKMESVPVAELIDNLDTNPTLTQLNMEPEMSFVSDILNLDQDDSKMSYSLDYLCSDVTSSLIGQCNLNTMSVNSLESPSNSIPYTTKLTSLDPVKLSKEGQKPLARVEQEYVKSTSQNNKSNFPPRAQQPTLIGVVSPVKNNEDDSVRQSHTLQELLTKKTLIKTEPDSNSSSDKTAQIVPFLNILKMKGVCQVKEEPLSPQSNIVVKDESTEEKWKDIQKFIHSPEQDSPVRKRRRYDSGSSSHISEDDDEDDDRDNDDSDYDDVDSDIDADIAQISPKDCESLVATGKKQKQFFWQYNVQSKGPKGTRLKLAVESPADPHVLNDFEDPVFDECNTTIAGIRHGGKARKGDGNEITPNPKKLFMIGHQLMKLNRQIMACQLGADVPTAKRNESRKEKNKLASRACRLKKKAQHEANKIKLYGLEQEHGQLNSVLHYLWPYIQERAKCILEQSKLSLTSPSKSLTSMLEAAIAQSIKDRIAGNTTDYVNSVILKVESGDQNGGLTIKKSRKS
ncbi:protein CREBRF isoform X1 [Biomphalaria glabrata]|uniref:CREB3 regulatory factor-like isoform X1 n=2 Tax=Biomphalaria glabrata TaxID=6526 RepID=A0A9U8EEC8_BIOGL|nr:CREB3 regulatory factor-like isoform X1 [Biomphalaria glabrata]KAI8770203.1 putative protein CREBRF isoform X1 [Biomphalaria glabrata]